MGHYRRSAAALVAAQAGKLLRLGLAAMIVHLSSLIPKRHPFMSFGTKRTPNYLISLSRRQNGHDGRCGPNGGASLLSMYLGARCGFRISNAFLMLKLKSRLSEY